MSKTRRGGTPPPGIQIEQRELGRNEMIMVAASVATIALSIALAIAAVKIATGLKWAIIVASAGPSGYWLLRGLGDVLYQRLVGRALLEQAKRGACLELHPGRTVTWARILTDGRGEKGDRYA